MEFGSFMVTSVLFLEFSRRGILGVGWFVINSIVAVMSYAIKPKKKEKFFFFFFEKKERKKTFYLYIEIVLLIS